MQSIEHLLYTENMAVNTSLRRLPPLPPCVISLVFSSLPTAPLAWDYHGYRCMSPLGCNLVLHYRCSICPPPTICPLVGGSSGFTPAGAVSGPIGYEASCLLGELETAISLLYY